MNQNTNRITDYLDTPMDYEDSPFEEFDKNTLKQQFVLPGFNFVVEFDTLDEYNHFIYLWSQTNAYLNLVKWESLSESIAGSLVLPSDTPEEKARVNNELALNRRIELAENMANAQVTAHREIYQMYLQYKKKK